MPGRANATVTQGNESRQATRNAVTRATSGQEGMCATASPSNTKGRGRASGAHTPQGTHKHNRMRRLLCQLTGQLPHT
jgi:hypothetical protein